VRFHPAGAGAGITFQRVDLPGTPAIPALVEYVPPRQRRTALEFGGATVEPGLTLSYTLDYGAGSPIPQQSFEVTLTPEAFLNEVVYARTFVLEQEVAALRAQGYGRRTTAADLLIYGADGVVGNTLRSPNECARHKLLDCVGDFALLGCDLWGRVAAHRSGHSLNSRFIRQVGLSHPAQSRPWPEHRAA